MGAARRGRTEGNQLLRAAGLSPRPLPAALDETRPGLVAFTSKTAAHSAVGARRPPDEPGVLHLLRRVTSCLRATLR